MTEQMQDCSTNAIHSYATVDRFEGGVVVLEVEKVSANKRELMPVEAEVETYMADVPIDNFFDCDGHVKEGSVFCVVHNPETEEVHYIMEHDEDEEKRRRDYIAMLESEINGG